MQHLCPFLCAKIVLLTFFGRERGMINLQQQTSNREKVLRRRACS